MFRTTHGRYANWWIMPSSPHRIRSVSENLRRMRHSCAHLLAAAVYELFPGVKFGVGPAIDDGCFYDIQLDQMIKHEDLEAIEQRMRDIAKRNLRFEHFELPVSDARDFLMQQGQPFKLELVDLLQTHGT